MTDFYEKNLRAISTCCVEWIQCFFFGTFANGYKEIKELVKKEEFRIEKLYKE
jgi:hypothetical protein